ncbi:MAG: flagellar basal body P-ring formation chaperone FlgA [bacterium]
MKNYLAVLLTVVVALLVSGESPQAATCEQAITGRLAAMYDLDTNAYAVEVLSCRLKSVDIESDDIIIRPLTPKEPLGLFTVMVDVKDDGRVIESGQVRLRIKKFADVLVAADKIRNRQLLTGQCLTIRRMDVTSLNETPLRTLSEIDGFRARRNLRRGTILTTGAVEPVPDIEAGREVSIVYVDDLFRITVAGVALQAGIAGEYVKVKNRQSGKIIVARVVDETVVAVDR